MIGGYLDFVRGEGDEVVTYTNFNELLHKIINALEIYRVAFKDLALLFFRLFFQISSFFRLFSPAIFPTDLGSLAIFL